MSEADLARAFGGGVLIGAGASVLLLLNGQIAGVSGILGKVIRGGMGDQGWRIAFLLGLIAPVLIAGPGPAQLPATLTLSAVSGVLVGFGTRLGSGCTSGHGVCGLANLSTRSLVATVTFMATAVLTVYLSRHGLTR